MPFHVSRQIWLAMGYLAILCIILTSTVCFTAGKRNKCGPIVREHNCDCKAKTAGMLKRDGEKLLMCDGNEWKGIQQEVALGSSKKNPGYSCKDILDAGQTDDGVYWITLTGRFCIPLIILLCMFCRSANKHGKNVCKFFSLCIIVNELSAVSQDNHFGPGLCKRFQSCLSTLSKVLRLKIVLHQSTKTLISLFPFFIQIGGTHFQCSVTWLAEVRSSREHFSRKYSSLLHEILAKLSFSEFSDFPKNR